MPLSAKDALGSLGSGLSDMPIISVVTKNPFYTAVVIVIIIFITILFVFKDEEIDDIFKLTARVCLYALIPITAVQFLQNQNVMNEMSAQGSSERMNNLFSGANESATSIQARTSENTMLNEMTSSGILNNHQPIVPANVSMNL